MQMQIFSSNGFLFISGAVNGAMYSKRVALDRIVGYELVDENAVKRKWRIDAEWVTIIHLKKAPSVSIPGSWIGKLDKAIAKTETNDPSEDSSSESEEPPKKR